MRAVPTFLAVLAAISCVSPSVVRETAQAPPQMFQYPELASSEYSIETLLGTTPDCSRGNGRSISDRGLVSIRTGQTICISFELENGYFVPQLASQFGPGVVVMTLSLSDEGDNARLSVFDPFEGFLKYRAGMRIPGDQNLYATSSCPVTSGGVGGELWWHPVDEIVATDFYILPESDEFVCS